MRLFCFTSADADRNAATQALDELLPRLQAALAPQPPTAPELTWSVDHFNANFSRCGSWDAWSRSIPRERDRFQRPAYDHFIAVTDFPSGRFGKATAAALSEALLLKRPVHWIALDGSHGGLFCSEVRQVAEHDFRHGWALLQAR